MTSPKLKKFQEKGRDFLASRTRALLADDMRLGKTWQAIAAFDKVKASRVRIICPGNAVGVWKATTKALSPSRSLVTEVSALHAGACVEVFSYDMAREHVDKFLAQPRVDVLIADESHYAKTPTAQRAALIFGKGQLGWFADRIWCLSGTPAPNHAGELWTMASAFGATKMGYADWLSRYCKVDNLGKVIGTRVERVPELRKVLDPYMLRRLKSEAAPELPKLSVEPMYVDPSSRFVQAARPLHDIVLARDSAKLERKLRDALAELPPEKQLEYLENHTADYATLRRYNSLLKLDGVYQQVLFELEQGLVDKLVVFAYHREAIKTMEMLFKDDFNPVVVWGGNTPKQIEARVAKFTKNKRCRMFIGQIQAAGTAIDLSAAHQGLMLERDWVPGNNAQAMDRMGGFKQTRPVTIRDVRLPDSIDDVVNAVLARKEAELAAIFD